MDSQCSLVLPPPPSANASSVSSATRSSSSPNPSPSFVSSTSQSSSPSPSSSSSALRRKSQHLVDPSPGQLTLVVTCVVTQGPGGGGGGGSSGGGTSGTSISKNQMRDYLFFSDPRKKRSDGDNHGGQQQPFYGAPIVLHFDLYPTVWLLSYLQRQVDCRCQFYVDSTASPKTMDLYKQKAKEQKEKEKEGGMSSDVVQRIMESGRFEAKAIEGRQCVNSQAISNHRNDHASYDESRNVRCNDTHETTCSTSSSGQFFLDGRPSLSSSPHRVPSSPSIRGSCQIDRGLRLLLDLPLSLVPSPFPCCRGVVSWSRSYTLLPPVSMFPLSLQKKEKRHRRHPLVRGIMKRKEEREGLLGTRTGLGGGLRGCEARFPFAIFRVAVPSQTSSVEKKSQMTSSVDVSSGDTTSSLQGELTRQEETREREASCKKEVHREKSDHSSSLSDIGSEAPRIRDRSKEEEESGQENFSLQSSSPTGGPPASFSSSLSSSSSSARLDGQSVSSSSSLCQSSLLDPREDFTLLNVVAVACPDGYVILIDWKARAQQMQSIREQQKAKGVHTPSCPHDIPSLKVTISMKETSHQQSENIPAENTRIIPPIEEKDSSLIQVKRRESLVLQTVEDGEGIEGKNLPFASRDGAGSGVDALENGKTGRGVESGGRKDDITEEKEERRLRERMATSQDLHPINRITQATIGGTTDRIDTVSMTGGRENTSSSPSSPSQDTLGTHSSLKSETVREKRRKQTEAGGDEEEEEGKELSLLSEEGDLVVLGATMLGASAAMAKELKVRDDGEALLLRCTDRMVVARLIYPWTCSPPERKTFVKVYREQEREQRHAFLLQQQKQQMQLSHRLAAKNNSAGVGGDSGRTGGKGRGVGFSG